MPYQNEIDGSQDERVFQEEPRESLVDQRLEPEEVCDQAPEGDESKMDAYGSDKSHNKALGAKGEEAAVAYLMRQGYEILERNWRCSSGEADIIAIDEEDLVFVEVKTRTNEAKGLPSEAVTPSKRRKYECIAMAYLKQSDHCGMRVRFDVVSIMLLSKDRAFLRHHKNAFGAGD